MTTAIIIVILIVFLSIGLFFLIKKLSYASDMESEVYETESAITDFNSIPKDVDENIDDNNINKSKSEAKFAIIISKIYKFFYHQMQNLDKIILQYKQRQAEKMKAKEIVIQEAIQKDLEAQELEEKQKQEAMVEEADTSHFEAEIIVSTNMSSDVNSKDVQPKHQISSETKATDFVEQLLSEVDAVVDINSDDIDDTYYYEYMEKRYIDRIVANPKDIEAYKKLGDLYVDMRNYKDALEAFEYVLKLKPNDTMASRRVKDISNRFQKQN
ncbi:tetratricopeptide repeat protein [bacterium]|nr:tetratricopeptide repeat protein [Candidatus Elulimicrobium humile]